MTKPSERGRTDGSLLREVTGNVAQIGETGRRGLESLTRFSLLESMQTWSQHLGLVSLLRVVYSSCACHRVRNGVGGLLLLIGLNVLLSSPGQARDVILRNLTRLSGVTVVSLHDEFARLSNDQLLPWNRILAADLIDQQLKPKLDQRIRDYGLPLFRMYQRLNRNDIEGAGRIAVRLFDQRIDRLQTVRRHPEGTGLGKPGELKLSLAQQAQAERIRNETRFAIALLASQHWLDRGQRANALLAFFVTRDYQELIVEPDAKERRGWMTTLIKLSQSGLPHRNRFPYYHPSIQPIWFDLASTRQVARRTRVYFGVVEDVSGKGASVSANDGKSRREVPPGVALYLASMDLQLNENLADGRQVQNRLQQVQAALKLQADSTEPQLASAVRCVEGQLMWRLGNRERADRLLRENHPLATYVRFAPVIDPDWSTLRTDALGRTGKRNQLERPQTLSEAEHVEPVLALLSIAANDGVSYPHLAAAALSSVARYSQAIGDRGSQRKIEQELITRYPQTDHARAMLRTK